MIRYRLTGNAHVFRQTCEGCRSATTTCHLSVIVVQEPDFQDREDTRLDVAIFGIFFWKRPKKLHSDSPSHDCSWALLYFCSRHQLCKSVRLRADLATVRAMLIARGIWPSPSRRWGHIQKVIRSLQSSSQPLFLTCVKRRKFTA